MGIIQNTLKSILDVTTPDEGKVINQAWETLKESLPDEERFPNGFTNWYETHAEIVSLITLELRRPDSELEVKNKVYEIHSTEGTGGVYELGKKWTDEFELLNKDRDWDGEFFDEVEEFFKVKNYQ